MKAQVLHKYDDDFIAPSWVDFIDVPDPVITKGSDVIVRIGGAVFAAPIYMSSKVSGDHIWIQRVSSCCR